MPKLFAATTGRYLMASDRNRALAVGIAFGSGLLMGLAPAPLNAFPLAWVALAPLWVLLTEQAAVRRDSECRRSRCVLPSSVYLALAWGVGYHGLALSWITGLHPLTWLGVPWLASVAIVLFCWGFITLWGAALVMVWAWLMERLGGVGARRTSWPGDPREGQETISTTANPAPITVLGTQLSPLTLFAPLRRVLLGTTIWCTLEWVWSWGPLDWTALAYTQSPGNLLLVHLGQISGPSTVTAAIVAVNGLLAEAWISYQSIISRRKPAPEDAKFPAPLPPSFLITGAIGFLALLHLLGYGLYTQPIAQPSAAALNVGIIQGNVPTRIKLGSEGIRRATVSYTSGYNVLAQQGVDAVLTPEGALPFLWNDVSQNQSPLYQAVLQKRVVLWLGTFTTQAGGIARSLLTIDGNGTPLSRYNKIKLVPLGEYIPFQDILGNVINILSPVTENGAPGTLNQQFDTPLGRAIASICYDSAFSEVFRAQAAAGGEFILTASNLDPYSEVLMAQHQAQDLMRAIETDRWAVRATNTGYSGVIDPHGRIVWRSRPHTYETHAATVFRRQTQTPYVRWGDWLTPTLIGLAAIVRLRSWV